jgi:hypothetical protein
VWFSLGPEIVFLTIFYNLNKFTVDLVFIFLCECVDAVKIQFYNHAKKDAYRWGSEPS